MDLRWPNTKNGIIHSNNRAYITIEMSEKEVRMLDMMKESRDELDNVTICRMLLEAFDRKFGAQSILK